MKAEKEEKKNQEQGEQVHTEESFGPPGFKFHFKHKGILTALKVFKGRRSMVVTPIIIPVT